MSHSQFHCTGHVYLDLHGLIFETSICYWQDQPGSPNTVTHRPPAADGARVRPLRWPGSPGAAGIPGGGCPQAPTRFRGPRAHTSGARRPPPRACVRSSVRLRLAPAAPPALERGETDRSAAPAWGERGG